MNGGIREGFGEALQSEISVSHVSEAFMLSVQVEEGNIATAHNVAGPLLCPHVIVTEVIVIKNEIVADGLPNSKHIS